MMLKYARFALLGLMFSNCNSDETLLTKDLSCTESSNIIITSTKVCGWFPNYDSMSINSKSLKYYNYCMADKPVKEYPITCDEWSLLLSKLDVEEFRKLTINTCNLCVDGCDISLSIKSEDQFHRIKFGPNQIPDSIKEFVEKIEALRADTKAKACS
jgi:hypothetical protein